MRAHPVAALFPLMTDAELRELGADIKANGMREPIVVDDVDWMKAHPMPRNGRLKTLEWRKAYEKAIEDGEILVIDGRNRYTACKLAGIPWPSGYNLAASDGNYIRHRSFGDDDGDGYDDDAIVSFILSKNVHRRHLTESQRAMVAAKIAYKPRGSNQHTETSAPSQAQVAEQLQVSVDSIQTARKVIEHGAPELVAAVVNGKASVSAAAQVAEKPIAEQCEIVAGGKKKIREAAKEAKQEKAAKAAVKEKPAAVYTEKPEAPPRPVDDPLQVDLGRKFWSDLRELLQRKMRVGIDDASQFAVLLERRRLDEAVKDFVVAQEQAFADLRRACNRAREHVLRDRREAAEQAEWEAKHRRRMAEDPVYAAQQREIDRLIAEARKVFGGLFNHVGSDKYDEACKVLGLPDWTGNVTVDNARSAYRALARKHHPDLGGDPVKMSAINVAYDIVMTRIGDGEGEQSPTGGR